MAVAAHLLQPSQSSNSRHCAYNGGLKSNPIAASDYKHCLTSVGTPECGKLFLEALVDTEGCFDHTALQNLRNIRASPGRIEATMTVDNSVRNRYETLHGGCTATLVDTVGSAALVTVSQKSGVSLNISVTYLSAMPAGEDVEVDARVVRVGCRHYPALHLISKAICMVGIT